VGQAAVIVPIAYDGAKATTPSDSHNDPAGPFNGLLVWVAGTVSFVDASGNVSGTSGTIAAGTEIRVKVVRVNQTGTSATVLGLMGVA
jgi:hypothetical protein